MSEEELRIEIAEWCGYKWIENDNGFYYWSTPNGNYLYKGLFPEVHIKNDRLDEIDFPNYPSDLNAMWEAESQLKEKEMQLYSDFLYEDTGSESWWRATAKQRAIAFVKTIREIKK